MQHNAFEESSVTDERDLKLWNETKKYLKSYSSPI